MGGTAENNFVPVYRGGVLFFYSKDVYKRQTSGSVKVGGKELSDMNDEQLTIFRRRQIGFIFQNYNLVPILNVYEDIVLPIELDGNTADKRFVGGIVKMLGLKEKLTSCLLYTSRCV